ncbi:glycosyltransferase family 2 protein [Chelativorans sp. AA-79]|uniref:glycosyltransferase family 2 protein n=1 Tax=Chelativorans sp. AA-79 TaxID=3028735 RepID=UPI0023F90AB1|nr:glycosyltransferase family 2 protein [Chelativorans sp. AA-79]WEX08175.1 glycosyltransferase family 2 protein [Chelativorans sp. AA-79]
MTGAKPGRESEPLVSVIMANYRSAEHLPAALDSVLAQTVRDLEVIVSDDASPDESADVVRRYMERDPRVQLITTDKNSGPASARNRALEAARGVWIAIVDSDDIIHPERFEMLIAAATQLGADGIADDLLFFSDAGPGGTLLGETAKAGPQQITPARFIRSNTSGNGLPPLGYVKPLLKREKLAGLRYDEAVRIGEDYDFLLRFLLAGGRFFITPELLYLYRRHAQSISHRLSEGTVLAMIANQQKLTATCGRFPPDIEGLLEDRMAALRALLSFEHLVLSIKERRMTRALRQLAASPGLVRPLARSVAENLEARFKRKRPAMQAAGAVAFHDAAHPPQEARALHAASGIDLDVEIAEVPPYEPPPSRSPSDGASRALHLRFAAMAMQSDMQVVCHGLAGLHATGFLPRKRIMATVVDRPEELDRILEWPEAGSRLVIAEALLPHAPALETLPFCPGYRLLVRKEHAPAKPARRTRSRAANA